MSTPLAWLAGHWARGVGPRGRRVLHGSAWSLVSKACSAANLLLALLLVKGVLDPTRFGIWATIVSLVTVGNFLDFGFSNGALNLVAGAQGRGATDEIGRIAHAARRPLLAVAAAFAAAGAAAVVALPWPEWLGARDVASSELRLGLGIVVATTAAGIPLNVATRVLIGMGHAATVFRWQAAAQVASLCVLALLCASGAGLPALVAAAAAVPLLAPVANTLQLRRHLRHADVRPSDTLAAAIRREGALFFALQLAAALAFGLDLALVSRLQGAEAAGAFAVPQRAFSVVSLALGLLWTPLWPTYRHALAAGDGAWVGRMLRRSIIGATVFASFGAAAVAAAFAIGASLGLFGRLYPDPRLVVGFAAWTVAESVGGALATFFNAASIMRYQVIVATILAVTCLAAKAWAIARWGAWASPWTTLAVYTGVNLLPTAVFGPRLVRRALQSRHY